MSSVPPNRNPGAPPPPQEVEEPDALTEFRSSVDKHLKSLVRDESPDEALNFFKRISESIIQRIQENGPLSCDNEPTIHECLDAALPSFVSIVLKNDSFLDHMIPTLVVILQNIARICALLIPTADSERLLEGACRLFLSNKHFSFYKTVGTLMEYPAFEDDVEDILKPFDDRRDSVALRLVVRSFIGTGGFLNTVQRLRSVIPGTTSTEPAIPLPLSFVRYLLIILRRVLVVMDPGHELTVRAFPKVQEAVIARIRALTDDEIKGAAEERDFLYSFSAAWCQFVDATPTNESQAAAACDLIRLEIANRMLRCPYLEKRLYGLTEIRNACKWATDRISKKPIQQEAADWKCTDYRFFISWIKSNSIIPYLFGPNFHLELAKRAPDILMLAARDSALGAPVVDMLWDAQVDKHESICHLIYSVISDVSHGFSRDGLKRLYEKVRSIPPPEYSVQFVSLLSQLGICVAWNFQPDYESDTEEDNAVDPSTDAKENANFTGLLWHAILSSSLSPQVASACQESITKIVQTKYSVWRERRDLATSCLAILSAGSEKREFVLIALRLLWRIVEALERELHDSPAEKDYADAQKDLRDEIFVQNNLPVLVFKETVSFAASDLLKSRNDPAAAKQTALSSFSNRLDFISYFTFQIEGYKPDRDFLQKAWVSLVNIDFPEAREIALKWIMDACAGSLVPEDSFWFFHSCLATMDVVSLGENGWKTYEYFFKLVSWQAAKEASSTNPMAQFEFAGLESLWNIIFQVEHAGVAQAAITTLVRLFGVPTPDGSAVPPPQILLHKTMEHLSKISAKFSVGDPLSSRAVSRCIVLLQKILAEHNNPQTVVPSGPGRNATTPARTVTLKVSILKPRSTETVTALSCDSIWTVKQKISQIIGEPAQTLRLITAGKELSDDQVAIDYYIHDATEATLHCVSRVSSTATNSPSKPSADSDSARLSIASPSTNTLSSILSDRYFDDLFALLVFPAQLGQQVWDLIMKLPTNRGQLEHLRSLDIASPDEWENLLNHSSTFKLYYSLQIISSLMQSKSAPGSEWSREAWLNRFISLGGVKYLIQTMLNVNFLDESKGNKRISCLALLVRIIAEFVLEPRSSASTEAPRKLLVDVMDACGVDQRAVVTKLMEIIFASAQAGASFGLEDDTNKEKKEEKAQQPEAPVADVATPGEHLVASCIGLLTGITASHEGANIEPFLQLESIGKWLEMTTLLTYSERIREGVSSWIIQIVDSGLPAQVTQGFCHHILDKLLITLSSITPSSPTSHVVQYFKLIAQLIRRCAQSASQFLTPLSELLVDRISNHPVVELRGVPFQDHVLQGLLEVLHSVISVSPQHKVYTGAAGGLVRWLFNKGLFEFPTPDNSGPNCPPRCKSAETRNAAFATLLEYGNNCHETFEILAACMSRILQSRETPLKTWSHAPAAMMEKASSGLVGLKNLGATCYMNSLTQQFYMIPQFRASLFQAEEKEAVENPEDSILFQLQAIMANLQESERGFSDTVPFCRAYKMNPGVQMDVDEYFLSLFDKLEKATKGTPHEKMFKTFFGGQVVHQIVSKECEHVSERDEDFFNLSVEVKNKRKIEESLELFIQGDLLDGDNKYMCEKCNKRVDALKRCCLKTLPNNLFIHLKRFDFDLELLRRSKINDLCEFPMVLNVEPYTREGLSRREHGQTPPSEEELRNYAYELTGVIVHTGTVDSGHYYSFIKDRSSGDANRWFCFNDASVEPFDPKDLPAACFGGYDQYSGRTRAIPRHYSAYMLVYSKIQPSDPQVNTPLDRAQLAKAVPKALYQQTWRDNIDFLSDKYLFDSNFFQFVMKLMALPHQDNSRNSAYSPEVALGKSAPFDPAAAALEIGTRFFAEILCHAKEKETYLLDLTTRLRLLIAQSPRAAQWLLHHLTRTDLAWVHKLIQECFIPAVRGQFLGLLHTALSALAPFEKSLYNEATIEDIVDTPDQLRDRELEKTRHSARKSYLEDMHQKTRQSRQSTAAPTDDEGLRPLSSDVKLNIDTTVTPRSLVIRFMDQYLSLLPEMHVFYAHLAEYFALVEYFAGIGAEERAYLVQRNALCAMLEFYLGPDSPNWTGAPRKNSEVSALETTAISGMRGIIGTMSIILRSCKAPGWKADSPVSPFAVATELSELPTDVRQLLMTSTVVNRIIADAVFPEATHLWLAHWMWEDQHISDQLLGWILHGIEVSHHNDLGPFLQAFHRTLMVDDSLKPHRIAFGLERFVRIVLECAKHKTCTLLSVKSLVDLVESSDVARELLFQGIPRWVQPLLFHTSEHVRIATEQLILSLCPWVAPNYDSGYEKIAAAVSDDPEDVKKRSAHRINLRSTPPPDGIDSESRLRAIYNTLLSFLPNVTEWVAVPPKALVRTAANPYPTAPYRLRQWGRLLNFLLRSNDQKEAFVPHVPVLLQVLAWFEEEKNQKQCDWNKYELLNFLDALTTDCPVMCNAVAAAAAKESDLRVFLDKLINYAFWADASDETTVKFNDVNVPCYFSILLRVSQVSRDFLALATTGSRIFNWLAEYIYIRSTECERGAAAMLEFVRYAAANSESWRRGFLVSIIPMVSLPDSVTKTMSRNVALIDSLLVDPSDVVVLCEHRGMTFLFHYFNKEQQNIWTKTKPDQAYIPALRLMKKLLTAKMPELTTPAVSASAETLRFRTQLVGDLQKYSTVSCLIGSLCFFEENFRFAPADVPVAAGLIRDLLESLFELEPTRFFSDLIVALTKFFNENAVSSRRHVDAAMDVDLDGGQVEQRLKTIFLFFKLFKAGIAHRMQLVAQQNDAMQEDEAIPLSPGGTPLSAAPNSVITQAVAAFDAFVQLIGMWALNLCDKAEIAQMLTVLKPYCNTTNSELRSAIAHSRQSSSLVTVFLLKHSELLVESPEIKAFVTMLLKCVYLAAEKSKQIQSALQDELTSLLKKSLTNLDASVVQALDMQATILEVAMEAGPDAMGQIATRLQCQSLQQAVPALAVSPFSAEPAVKHIQQVASSLPQE